MRLVKYHMYKEVDNSNLVLLTINNNFTQATVIDYGKVTGDLGDCVEVHLNGDRKVLAFKSLGDYVEGNVVVSESDLDFAFYKVVGVLKDELKKLKSLAMNDILPIENLPNVKVVEQLTSNLASLKKNR